MYEALDRLSLKEIIGYCIESEKNTAQIYRKISKDLPELMSNRFKSLADDEDLQREQLLKIHKILFGDKKYVVPKKEGLPRLQSDVTSKSVGNLLDALAKAIDHENNVYKVYKYISENHEEQKDLFEYLAMMEHGHLESLKKEKEMLEGKVSGAKSGTEDRDSETLLTFSFEKRQTQ